MVRCIFTLSVALLVALGGEARMQKHGLSRRSHAGRTNLTLPFDDPKELERRDGTKYVFMHHVRSSTCISRATA